MSDAQQKHFPNWAKGLLILLVLAVAVQSWVLVQLSTSNDTSPRNKESTETMHHHSPTDSPLTLSDPFDSQHWDPLTEFQRMREHMDQVFNEAFGRFKDSHSVGTDLESPLILNPRIDVREKSDAYEVTVNLPGVDQAEIETELKDRTLWIRARSESRREEKDEDQGVILRQERRVGQFQRSITFPEPVDPVGMTSTFKNGVLNIHIPKTEQNSSNGDLF